MKKLKDIAECFIGVTYSPNEITENGVKVLRSGNIQNSILDLKDEVRIDKKVAEKYYVQKNDILMCSRNGSANLVGKVAIIPELNEKMTFGAFMTIIRSEKNQYLFYYFRNERFRQGKLFRKTTTINQITKKELEDIVIPIPNNEIVKKFADFVEETDKLKVAIENTLNKLKNILKNRKNIEVRVIKNG